MFNAIAGPPPDLQVEIVHGQERERPPHVKVGPSIGRFGSLSPGAGLQSGIMGVRPALAGEIDPV